MNPRKLLVITATLALRCGTLQPFVGPEQEALSSGFPSKPWPNQYRPGPDGKCEGKPPYIIAVNGGCWVALKVELADCTAKENGYFVAHEGHCYYPMFKLPFHEPTSSIQQFILEEK